MKKNQLLRLAWVCVLLGFIYNANAQINLVPNPSFEDETGCSPGAIANLGNAIPNVANWEKPGNGTSDHFTIGEPGCNQCNIGAYDIQGFKVCDVGPRTGTGVGGMYSLTPGGNYREYMGVELKSKLIKGTEYFVEFYVHAMTDRFLDRFGIIFTKGRKNQFQSTPITTDTDIESPPGEFITKDMGWYRISGTYTPTQNNIDWITLGNFYSNNNTNSQGPTTSFSYYLIDDVRIIPTACLNQCGEVWEDVSIDFVPNVITPNGDGINDLYNVNVSNALWWEGQVIDRWGVVQNSKEEGRISLNGSGQPVVNMWNGEDGNSGVGAPVGVYYPTLTIWNCADTVQQNLDNLSMLVNSPLTPLLPEVPVDYYMCCREEIILNGRTFQGVREYQATNRIFSSNSTVQTGADLTFTAGNEVELGAGFEVEAGATFLAQIGPCTEEPPERLRDPSLALAEAEEQVEKDPLLREMNLSDEKLQVIPNPVRGRQAMINIPPQASSELNVQIFDNQGRLMTNFSLQVPVGKNFLAPIRLDELPEGMYICRVYSGTGKTWTSKFMLLP